jgi:hypothetical protein
MNTRFKNQDKMKNFLETHTGEEISNEDFNNCLDYLIEMANYINKETDGNYKIREGASLSIDINDEEYEVYIQFDSVIENNERSMLIDFDYTHEPQII